MGATTRFSLLQTARILGTSSLSLCDPHGWYIGDEQGRRGALTLSHMSRSNSVARDKRPVIACSKGRNTKRVKSGRYIFGGDEGRF
jgi:hypothetical protein